MDLTKYKFVFIVGCQRTGTSLIGNIIGSHPDCFLLDEPDGLYKWLDLMLENKAEEASEYWTPLLTEANKKYRKKYSRLDSNGNIQESVKLIALKAPNATYSIKALKEIFPDSTYIYPVRDIRDIVSSMRRLIKIPMLDKQISQISEHENILNKYTSEYRKLLDATVSEISKMAIIAKIKLSYLDEYIRENMKVLRVPYEDLVGNKNFWSNNIIQHIGIEYNDLCDQHEKVMRGMGPGLTFRGRPVDNRSVSAWRVRLTANEEKDIWQETKEWMELNGYKKSKNNRIHNKYIDNELVKRPIIATGRGGSGTRLLSSILINSGVFMGNYLNESLDSTEWVDLIYESVYKKTVDKEFYKHEKLDSVFIERASRILNDSNVDNITSWGFKLPETILILPQLSTSFDHSLIIHLVRHPVDTCLRRTHMTSRTDNFIGKVVLPSAYNYVGRDKSKIETDEEYINNAISYKYQVEQAVDFGRNQLGPARYIEIKYEDICSNLDKVIRDLSGFAHLPMQNRIPELEIEGNRIRSWSVPDKRAEEIWDICGEIGITLGYTYPD